MEILLVAVAVLAVIAGIFALWRVSVSNGFKRKRIKVQEALSGIEVALTKRCDMLTKLLDVAKGYMGHERELFAQVVQMRQGMGVREMRETDTKLSELEARLFAVAENYPQLRSADVFVQLEHGVRDAEEHLQAARRLYNATVSAYNTGIAVFPASAVAKSQALTPLEFFEADADKRADVNMAF